MSSQPLIVNEVLAFIQYFIHCMEDDSIVQVCRRNFDKSEISNARLQLYQILNKVDQVPSRREDSTQNICQDIFTLMRETGRNALPNFVVKDVFKLVAIRINDFDVTKILRDVTSLKASVTELQKKLEVSNRTVSDLRAEVVQLRSAVSVTKSPDKSHVNAQRKAQNAATSSQSALSSEAPAETKKISRRTASTRATTPAAPPEQEPARVSTLTAKRAAYADIAAARQSVSTQKNQAAQTKLDQANQTSSKNDTCNNDGFIKVERKKKKKPLCRNQCGTAPIDSDSPLYPAKPMTQLYLSRLHYTTTVEDVVEYMYSKTGRQYRVVMLESRYNMNHKSFVVWVHTRHLENFLDEKFWPKGVVYRRFRGRLPNTSQLAKHDATSTSTACIQKSK
ncbi:unnamed protein product [Spodoptera exigua]|nr:unnamed protein product [Spodoptera exigua]